MAQYPSHVCYQELPYVHEIEACVPQLPYVHEIEACVPQSPYVGPRPSQKGQ